VKSNPVVILVDAGTGNLHSVHNALIKLGAEVILSADPQVVQCGGRVILPGVGAFGHFMQGLIRCDLPQALESVIRRGDPLLGICVGMQALFESSEELSEPNWPGMGFLPGHVLRFPQQPGLKVPHTGWNQVSANPSWTGSKAPSTLLEGLASGSYAYFNHSYYCAPVNPTDILTFTDYGAPFTSMVHRGNLCGVQFHPEKSQAVGLQILKNFLSFP
jgi:glutamine amidotransferase